MIIIQTINIIVRLIIYTINIIVIILRNINIIVIIIRNINIIVIRNINMIVTCTINTECYSNNKSEVDLMVLWNAIAQVRRTSPPIPIFHP